ncbi:MAG TPA: FIST N-terminal domain-containing protein [Acidimicrobiales bacterium]|nr:FIST N-terminal domain-containing protein [Acidimicrobiales bacterium]
MNGPRFAGALSQHPITAHAVGEVAGAVLESVGAEPDLAVLFVTPPHAGALEDAARAVRSIVEPRALIGCAAESVIGDGREIEEGPAVSLWAGRVGDLVPVRLTARPGEPFAVEGWPHDIPFEPSALVLLADPFSFPVEVLYQWLDEHHPGLPVLGGNASAARGPGGNRLALDDRVTVDGAVGVLLGPGVGVASLVSQGCRPIGQPLVVTKAERNIVYELGGQPAYERLMEIARGGLSEDEVRMVNEGLFMGLVIDEHRLEFGPGDFLVRNVMGFDPENGAIAVNDLVTIGTTAQFHVRDAVTADEELRRLLAGREADAALVFTCNGRGKRLFRTAHHDAALVDEALDGAPAAGLFCQGEFGPVGGRNFVHGFTASIALLNGA